MLISLLRTAGAAILLLIALMGIGIIIFHFCYQIYTEWLHVIRVISNLFILIMIMILQLVQYFAIYSLGAGLIVTIVAYVLLLALIVINTGIFLLL